METVALQHEDVILHFFFKKKDNGNVIAKYYSGQSRVPILVKLII